MIRSWIWVQTAQPQLDLPLMLGLNTRKLVSKLSRLFWGSFWNPKLLKQQEQPSLFSSTFSVTEGKENPHELIPVQIEAFLLGKAGEQLHLIFRTSTHGKPTVTLCKLPEITTNIPIPSVCTCISLAAISNHCLIQSLVHPLSIHWHIQCHSAHPLSCSNTIRLQNWNHAGTLLSCLQASYLHLPPDRAGRGIPGCTSYTCAQCCHPSLLPSATFPGHETNMGDS